MTYSLIVSILRQSGQSRKDWVEQGYGHCILMTWGMCAAKDHYPSFLHWVKWPKIHYYKSTCNWHIKFFFFFFFWRGYFYRPKNKRNKGIHKIGRYLNIMIIIIYCIYGANQILNNIPHCAFMTCRHHCCCMILFSRI